MKTKKLPCVCGNRKKPAPNMHASTGAHLFGIIETGWFSLKGGAKIRFLGHQEDIEKVLSRFDVI